MSADKRRELEDRIAEHGKLRDEARAVFNFHDAMVNAAVSELTKLVNTHEHDWRYRYTGRHGSDKGDDYYQCAICGADRVES